MIILSYFSQRWFSRLPYILPIVMAQGLSSGSSNPRCLRLQNVTGVEGKQNDVIVCSPEDWKSSKQHIIFFGGDVQDYRENMERHYINKNYAEWNLETTAELLHSKFQHSTIFVVKPAEMLINTFSIYRNFLRFDQDGRPEFTHDYGGLVHLAKLYRSAVGRLYKSEENGVCEGSVENSECSSSIPVKLMGFSKGCVVLTQLMHELSSYKDNEEVQAFLKKVSAIYWLDGGHTGGVKAYITDDDILKEVAGLGKELFVLVTPYQIKDVNRKWIGREEAEFVKKLKALKANIREFRFYMDDPPSIDNHFKVLTKVE